MPRSTLSLLFVVLLFASLGLASPAGSYVGKWVGANAEGAFKIALIEAGKGEWKANVSFTYGNADVECKIVSVKVENDSVELVYDFEIAGLQARSTVTGEIKGSEMSGKYHTQGADGSDVDQGTWKVSLTK